MLEGSLVVDQHPMHWREIVLVPLSIKTRNKPSEDFPVLFTHSDSRIREFILVPSSFEAKCT